MKESQEIKDYLELDHVEKRAMGSELHLVKEDFTVIVRAVMNAGRPMIRIDFQPPKKQYEEQH